MLKSLFRSWAKRAATPDKQPCIPGGQRVYAIGDIHGRSDLFERLLAMIEADDEARGAADTTIILLGDFVDRGPDSRKVIECAIALRSRLPSTRWLIGNHEEVFLSALGGDEKTLRFFVRIGGEQTINSYGLYGADYAKLTFAELGAALRPLVPREHINFMASGEDQIVIGDYLFVHAGIRPQVPLSSQKLSDLRWIRDPFLQYSGDHGHVVVHGHSITDAVDDCGNRIGIDTGAYASGVLTAIGLQGEERWVLST
ncbi:MAG: metallophosphoesterase [Sphingopyxis sp.]